MRIDLKDLKRSDKLLLRTIVQSSGEIHGFTLYNRYHISAAEIILSINRLKNRQIIESDGFMVRLTQSGREWLQGFRFELFSSEERPWRECPEDFKTERLEINKPYAPRISLLDKTFEIGPLKNK